MITLEAVAAARGGRTLFSGVDWTIHPRRRVGLVGPNGCGKTTLLEIVAGRIPPDAGTVRRRRDVVVAYLPQEVERPVGGRGSLLDTVLAGADRVRELERRLRALEDELERAGREGDRARLDRLAARYGDLRDLFAWCGGDDLEGRARAVLGGLGFPRSVHDKPIETFSGGWRMRASMARLLVSGADLVLLDEPTNHLDLEALAWLERHLATAPAAVVVVSHDRVFLDRVAGEIADLGPGGLRLTRGGYTAWRARREAECSEALARIERNEQEQVRLRRFVDRFRYKATKARQAQDRVRRLEQLAAERAAMRVELQRSESLRWPDPPPAPGEVAVLEGVSVGYGGPAVLSGVDLVLRAGERVGVLGPNGAGKSTLLRVLAGEMPVAAGRRRLGLGVVVGRFAQHHLEAFDPERDVLETARNAAPAARLQQVRAALGATGLGDDHLERPVATLSGGERARLALAILMLRPANLLLLDEPTNHLDLPMREALEEALADWPGTLVTVSHDRAFLERLTSTSWLVEAGRVERFDGDWEAYVARLSAGQRARDRPDPARAGTRSRAARRRRAEAIQERSRLLRPLLERRQQAESAIERCERRLAEIDRDLSDPSTHADGERMRALVAEREATGVALERAWSEWAAADEAITAVESEGDGDAP